MGKIKNPLLRPLNCDYCYSPKIRLAQNSVLYGRNYGDWPLIWFCVDCNAAVGCHPGTDIPLGKMADRATRQWRKKAHEAFDPIWKETKWLTRYKAYAWLASKLGIKTEDCHISWFNAKTCQRVIEICNTEKPLRRDYDPRKRKPRTKRNR